MAVRRIRRESRSRWRQRGIPVDGTLLRRARLDAGLTLADVAGTEMSKQAVAQFELGIARPTPAKLHVILDRLGLSLDAVRADRPDEHESRMADLDERQLHDDLERVARSVLRDSASSLRAKANAHYYLGRCLMYTAPGHSLQRARTARRQFRQMGEHARAAEARDCEAGALYMMEDPSALHVAQQALNEYREVGAEEPRVEARMLSNIATYQLGHGRYAEAIATYRDALDIAGWLLDLARLAQIYHGLAVAYFRTGTTRKSLEHMDRAVNLSRTAHDLRRTPAARLARLENDYGTCLMRTGNLDRAEEMIHSALDRYDDAHVEAERAYTLLSMGELARLRGRIDEAMEWTGQAIDLADQRSEVVALAYGYQQLGELHADGGGYERFEAYFARAMEILDRAGLAERRRECEARYERKRAAIEGREQSRG